jgi:pimeloyl-ACP methyl ester carboxylesterase
VAPLLRERGHAVATPDLPSHGADPAGWWRATLASYAQRTCDTARASGGRAIAVGHSMGGVVITEAAAREPEAFAGLVYLCAFVPEPGESLMSLGTRDAAGGVPAAMKRRLTRTWIRPERARDVFYGACDPGDVARSIPRLCAQPNLPMFQRVSAPRAALPPRAYVECSADRAISLAHQRFMHERARIARVASLAADHSPFYSAPAQLAETLDALARELP